MTRHRQSHVRCERGRIVVLTSNEEASPLSKWKGPEQAAGKVPKTTALFILSHNRVNWSRSRFYGRSEPRASLLTKETRRNETTGRPNGLRSLWVQWYHIIFLPDTTVYNKTSSFPPLLFRPINLLFKELYRSQTESPCNWGNFLPVELTTKLSWARFPYNP